MAARRTPKAETTIESSGNVFADLGLPHPEQQIMKAKADTADRTHH